MIRSKYLVVILISISSLCALGEEDCPQNSTIRNTHKSSSCCLNNKIKPVCIKNGRETIYYEPRHDEPAANLKYKRFLSEGALGNDANYYSLLHKKSETFFKDNKRHGRHTEYHHSGASCIEGNYIDDVMSGSWTVNDKNSRMIFKLLYQDGQIKSLTSGDGVLYTTPFVSKNILPKQKNHIGYLTKYDIPPAGYTPIYTEPSGKEAMGIGTAVKFFLNSQTFFLVCEDSSDYYHHMQVYERNKNMCLVDLLSRRQLCNEGKSIYGWVACADDAFTDIVKYLSNEFIEIEPQGISFFESAGGEKMAFYVPLYGGYAVSILDSKTVGDVIWVKIKFGEGFGSEEPPKPIKFKPWIKLFENGKMQLSLNSH